MWLQEDTDLVAELQTPGGFYPLPAAPPRPALWGHWLGMGGGPRWRGAGGDSRGVAHGEGASGYPQCKGFIPSPHAVRSLVPIPDLGPFAEKGLHKSLRRSPSPFKTCA